MNKYLKESVKYLLRSYPVIYPYIKEIERMYNMSHDELQERNERVFLNIFRKAYTKSSFYHKLYTEAGIKLEDIKCLDDISKLPIVTKDMILHQSDALLTTSKWKLLKNRTSGTTGTPLTVFEDWKSIWREQAYFYCYRKRCGYIYGQPLASLRGNLGKNETTLFIHVSNTLFLSSYNINALTASIYYNALQKRRPVAIEGYPSSLFCLAMAFKEMGLQCNIPVCFTSSECLMDYQKKLIEEQFSTQIFDHYGTTERTVRLSENINHNGYFEDPGYSINEYLKDFIITTSLINSAFPLIRYEVNDVIELDKSENNENYYIKRIIGRDEDFIICKDGSKVMRLDHIFKNASHVNMAQLIQYKKGELVIRIVPSVDFIQKDCDVLVANLNERVGKNNLDVSVQLIKKEQITYSSRNKFKYIISYLK